MKYITSDKMSEENQVLTMYCKYCEKNTQQEFQGDERKEGFIITFLCLECNSYHSFEFFGSQLAQPTELD